VECLLEPGEHVVKALMPGYDSVFRKLTVEAGKKRTEEIRLISNLAVIKVEASVENARVALNGVEMGSCPFEKAGLQPGDYLVRVMHDEYAAGEKTVTLKKGETLALGFILEKKGAEAGPARGSVVWRSLLFPGMGQYHAERKGVGTLFLVTELVSLSACATGIILMYYGGGQKDEPGIDANAWEYWDDYSTTGYWIAVGSGIAAGTVWLVNIIHAASMPLKQPDEDRALRLLPTPYPGGGGFVLTF